MDRKEDVFVSAVIYLSDESDNIMRFIEGLTKNLNEKFQHYEVIVVNDCCVSQDEFLNQYTEITTNKNLTIVHMSVHQGIEACMRAGIDVAIGDFVYEFDTLEYDFEKDLIWKAYQKSIEGNDIVTVEIKNNSLSRSLFYSLFNKFSQSYYDIHASVFRLVSRRAINRIASLNLNCEFRQAVYASCGLKSGRIEYEGMASSKKSRGAMLAVDSFLLYTDLPRRICVGSIKLIIGLVLLSIICIIIDIMHSNSYIGTVMFGIGVLGLSDIIICLIVLILYSRLILNGSIEGKNYLIEHIQKIQR